MEELKFLEEQQVASELIKRVEEFRSQYEVVPETAGRIVKPSIPFYGKDILEMAIAGLLKGAEPVTHRPKGNRKKYPCREPGIYFQPSRVQCFFSCKY
mgnify:CR=1 FL=1